MCDASDVIGYDRRTPELSNALLEMEYDNNGTEI